VSSLRIEASSLRGTIYLPPSKSQTHRAILFASMAEGKSVINNPLISPDIDAMIHAFRCFGATISINHGRLDITGLGGKIRAVEDVIDAKNSGIVLRFCSALGALSSGFVVVTGDYSLRHRRGMKELLGAFRQVGVEAYSMRGDEYAPVIIKGPMRGGKVTVDGSDSQTVSALLIAGIFTEEDLEIVVINPGEQPWVDLTLSWLDRLNIAYRREGYTRYVLSKMPCYHGFSYSVPGDVSSAAFGVVAALITNSEITVANIDLEDLQGDRKLFTILESMGARFRYDSTYHQMHVLQASLLQGREIDVNDLIDALPILAVLGCFANGRTRLYNGAVARSKESDRIASMALELRKMGAVIEETFDGLLIEQSQLHGANLHSHQDHRVAMALSVAALASQTETYIDGVEVMEKTFPDFVEKMHGLGAKIHAIS
jgi:3-phosphoshikimate 1-carboxyvinyltransferase